MKRKGVSRILEAVFAAILIIEAAYISYLFMIPPNPATPREKLRLYDLGYSLLTSISRDRGLDDIIFDENWNVKDNWQNDLKVLLLSLLPPNIAFELKVYNATLDNRTSFIHPVDLTNLNRISNVEYEEIFSRMGETVQITYIYTTETPNGNIQVYYLHLVLGVLRSV